MLNLTELTYNSVPTKKHSADSFAYIHQEVILCGKCGKNYFGSLTSIPETFLFAFFTDPCNLFVLNLGEGTK